VPPNGACRCSTVDPSPIHRPRQVQATPLRRQSRGRGAAHPETTCPVPLNHAHHACRWVCCWYANPNPCVPPHAIPLGPWPKLPVSRVHVPLPASLPRVEHCSHGEGGRLTDSVRVGLPGVRVRGGSDRTGDAIPHASHLPAAHHLVRRWVPPLRPPAPPAVQCSPCARVACLQECWSSSHVAC
jgi:hypothetical protein